MDLQFVSSGGNAVEYVLKTVSCATKPQHNLSVSSLARHSSGYTAVKAAVDSYRSAQAEDESLTGSRVADPCSN